MFFPVAANGFLGKVVRNRSSRVDPNSLNTNSFNCWVCFRFSQRCHLSPFFCALRLRLRVFLWRQTTLTLVLLLPPRQRRGSLTRHPPGPSPESVLWSSSSLWFWRRSFTESERYSSVLSNRFPRYPFSSLLNFHSNRFLGCKIVHRNSSFLTYYSHALTFVFSPDLVFFYWVAILPKLTSFAFICWALWIMSTYFLPCDSKILFLVLMPSAGILDERIINIIFKFGSFSALPFFPVSWSLSWLLLLWDWWF